MPSADPNADPVPARGGAFTYAGAVHWEYSPELDHDPDPGEIVWTWVAYEEDASVGKDRPVAVVGRTDDRRLVALMLSSRDHAGDRQWMSIGAGPWDREGRESWVRRDRILAVHASAVRREGAILPKDTFERIVSGLQGGAPTKVSSGSAHDRPRTVKPGAQGAGLFARLRRLLGR